MQWISTWLKLGHLCSSDQSDSIEELGGNFSTGAFVGGGSHKGIPFFIQIIRWYRIIFKCFKLLIAFLDIALCTLESAIKTELSQNDLTVSDAKPL